MLVKTVANEHMSVDDMSISHIQNKHSPDKGADIDLQPLQVSGECQLFYVDEAQHAQVDELRALISTHQLSLTLTTERVAAKLSPSRRQQLSAEATYPTLLLDNKNQLSWLSGAMSVAPEWDKLQRRVVSAGRKSELLLQAVKITADSHVIDATAGFGHDSLILASTGAQVTMLEQQPIMALLLLAEQQRMSCQPNWQKLMSRLHIIHTDALNYFIQDFASHQDTLASSILDNRSIDVIYLDPMFPEDSYQDRKTGKGAKVGKHMQALHHLAQPPTIAQEQQLLTRAQALIGRQIGDTHVPQQQGRVIVKRPLYAPVFATQIADENWHNAAVRFDGYLL